MGKTATEYIRPGEAMRLAGPGGKIIKAWVVKGIVRGFFTDGGHLYIHRQSLLDHLARLERKAARQSEPEPLMNPERVMRIVEGCKA